MSTKIGFIGQGWIGKHYADDFENRLYNVVRYSLEEPYIQNKEQIKECDIVFIAVPTPTIHAEGFTMEPVRDALSILADGAVAVIKSTLQPGSTELLQSEFEHLYVMHSPEFLREATAAQDAAKPDRNIIGIGLDHPEHWRRAEVVLRVLPEAPFNKIKLAREAEIVKYAGNAFLYTKVVFMNLLYDLVEASGADWDLVRDAMIADPRIGASHTQPIHKSGHDQTNPNPVRGAGGHCFIKDFEALRQHFELHVADPQAHAVFKALQAYNNELLRISEKDLDLLKEVHGE